LGAMLRKATSRSMLLHPRRFIDFIGVVVDSIRVDDRLKPHDLRKLAMRLKDLDARRVQFMTAPTEQLNARRGRQSVVLLDEPAMAQLFGKLRDDRFFTDDRTPAPKPTALTVAPGNIRIDVLNGSGVKGAARRAAQELAGVGFDVDTVSNADRLTYASTEIHHGPAGYEAARTVAAAVPGSRLVPDDTLDRTVAVVLGADFAGVQRVAVGARPPSSAPRPSVPTRTAADDPCAA
ncbi:MAG TPA: LytR C-terminal domain-containing protein, partial [Mycobacteriales bacterium]|nr:LytR C-terminal domain-containing protein [Mycobacteriales bacterium]